MRSIQPFLLRFPIRIFLFLLLSGSASGQFYNGYEMEFGKNRVQYDDRFWTFMKFKNFDTYYYLGGLELAAFTGRSADKDLEEIEKVFDYKLDGRIQFIIYNKLSEAKQSNIGLGTEETANNNIGGVIRIVDNKVFLYFTGNHEEFHRLIRAGIARVLTDQIMYGGDVKDRIQNSALLTLPDWYLNALISYVARGWDAEIDNRVRDGIISGRYRKFNHLTGTDALYAGHSVCKYIIDTYSESSVSNLLYMTRINRNVESGFNYVLGLSMRTLTDNWRQAMMNLYASSDAGRDSIGGTLVSYLLIAFAYDRPIATTNATRVFVTNRIGDAGFILGTGLSYAWVGSINWNSLTAASAELTTSEAAGISLCFSIAAFAKSVQLPFTPWLARAMEGPTPSSAVFYGAVMIHAGVYFVCLLEPVFEQAPFAMAVLAIVGCTTAIYNFIVGLTQADVKTSLVFATSGQLGLMFLECGLGFWQLASWHLWSCARVSSHR